MKPRVLVVEDDSTLSETLAYNLSRNGYNVFIAADGQAAIDMAHSFHPDLVVLDIMLPVMDGFDVCRILRQEMNVPIIMLTARDDEIDRVIGLEMGADDYLTKPFSIREFLARVKAHLRRVHMDKTESQEAEEAGKVTNEILGFKNLDIDLPRREVRLEGKPLVLKPKEYELLLFLARHKGQMMSRELILERVWGWEFTGGSRTVDVHVRWLREKIEPNPALPSRIITVRGAGYRFDG